MQPRYAAARRAMVAPLVSIVALGAMVGSVIPAARAAGGIARPGLTAPRVPASGPAASSAGGTPPLCDGPRDLIVERGPLFLHGTQTFDRLCVRAGGTLELDGNLSLRVGILDVAAGGAIDGNGADGHEYDTHDCISNDIEPNGAPGYRLAIAADEARIAGAVSADGGQGLANEASCAGSTSIGNGGAGGSITIAARHLTLDGHISARGGAGGAATASPDVAASSGSSGSGGQGGRVTLATPSGLPRSARDRVLVAGGAAGARGTGSTGQQGTAGTAILRALTHGEVLRLPPAPPPPLAVAVGLPAPLAASPTFTATMRCGPGDLDVRGGASVTLGGEHAYAHVCVERGGSLLARGRLTLVAQTILVASGAHIAADGGGPLPFHWSDSGRYEMAGACTTTHVLPHPGVRGVAGLSPPGEQPSDQDATPGDGGGVLTLVAHDAALDGLVSARGGRGQDGWYVDNPLGGTESSLPFGGGGGGSGGGIAVVADRLDLGGTLSAAGGLGGTGHGLDDAAGRHGGPGCIKVFARAWHIPAGGPALRGQAVIGRTLPTDPVPPQPGARYDAATGHNLAGPFLAFWSQLGGLDTLGAPRTDPYTQGGRLVQYTDRALLMLDRGHVQLAPLGRLLTAGRTFARVAPVASSATLRYFPATGHTVSGLFLAYWQAHDGAALLGAPLSQVVVESNGDGSRRRYPLQWFERGRLEYHAENKGTRYAVELGLLGDEALGRRRWLSSPIAQAGTAPAGSVHGASPSTHLYVATFAGIVFGSDGGRQWQYLSGPHTQSPQDCANIIALATTNAGRTVYQGTCSGSVFRSDDGGHSWVDASAGLPGDNAAVFDLVVAPDGRTIYAADQGGVYRTTDAGASWTVLFTPDEQAYDVEAVAVDPQRPAHLWAGTEGNGLYRSLDGGRHWVHVGGPGLPTQLWVYDIIPSPRDSADLYVIGLDGTFRTRDGGAHWAAVHGPWDRVKTDDPTASDIGSVAFDPLQPGHIYVGAGAGEYTSRDDGVSWVQSRGLAEGGSSPIFSATHPGLAYLLASSVYRTADGGQSWQRWDGGDLRPDDEVNVLGGYVP